MEHRKREMGWRYQGLQEAWWGQTGTVAGDSGTLNMLWSLLNLGIQPEATGVSVYLTHRKGQMCFTTCLQPSGWHKGIAPAQGAVKMVP